MKVIYILEIFIWIVAITFLMRKKNREGGIK